jgi:hypothetical protein
MQHVHNDNDWVYFEIRRGIYGLPQSGILAQKLLATNTISMVLFYNSAINHFTAPPK